MLGLGLGSISGLFSFGVIFQVRFYVRVRDGFQVGYRVRVHIGFGFMLGVLFMVRVRDLIQIRDSICCLI